MKLFVAAKKSCGWFWVQAGKGERKKRGAWGVGPEAGATASGAETLRGEGCGCCVRRGGACCAAHCSTATCSGEGEGEGRGCTGDARAARRVCGAALACHAAPLAHHTQHQHVIADLCGLRVRRRGRGGGSVTRVLRGAHLRWVDGQRAGGDVAGLAHSDAHGNTGVQAAAELQLRARDEVAG